MKKILIIGFVWPEPTATAAGSRMLQLIDVFLQNNYQITFVSAASNKQKSIAFKEKGIETYDIELNNSSFDILLKKINPDIVLFDRFLTEEQFGWRVTNTCPKAVKVLDTEDLHFLRKARHIAYKKQQKVTDNLLKSEQAIREIASIYRCDLTLIISKYEIKLLTKKFNINKSILIYTPFLLNRIKEEKINNYPSFEERKDFISIGNFMHEPNWNAVLNLKKEIWPNIKEKLPEANLLIYGAYSSQKVEQLHNKKEGFLIKGWANSAEEVISKSRVLLAPIVFGAGLKGKLIDSMLYGTPNVTTKIGAEAMHKKLPWNGYISNSFNMFSNKAIDLYTNKKVWSKSQINGVNIINNCFSKEKYAEKLVSKINKIENNLVTHRLNNFTGNILQHNTLKSTMYLSKWIEEKNKYN
ncbi:Glycosyltransferase involved in cell wall bisynthesis [Lutibacter oricola]|uniref:Glycosyltransferase involved in cell wall bisynthesis n=1 Tax=Lutibacter oricola TaxID=762486 RepID=A0A1H2XKB3_9FLAO|nr:glycosyltransferase [Lutibacter oricola]SDW92894.1 Glycosyltransferase involved in cell wall bisynthesis [Lutibacter oricola]